VLVVVAAGLVLGGSTSFLQTWLPHQVASLANSAGPWCAIAFGLARLGRRPGVAAAYGALALLSLDAGYYLTAGVRGHPVGTSAVAFWVVAALLVGPVLGLAARWLDARRTVLRVCAVAALPMVLVLEGIRSYVQVGGTTYRPYWVAEMVAGALLAGLLARRGAGRTATSG
jgi:hypothetical protein